MSASKSPIPNEATSSPFSRNDRISNEAAAGPPTSGPSGAGPRSGRSRRPKMRMRLALAAVAAAVGGGALVAGAGPAFAYNPCNEPNPAPRCYQKPPAPTPPPTTYQVSVSNYVQGDVGGWHQRSTVTVAETRQLGTNVTLADTVTEVTHTWDDDVFSNFGATVQADIDGPWLPALTYDVTGTFFSFWGDGTSDRTDTYTTSEPIPVADAVIATWGNGIGFVESLCDVAGSDCISQIKQS